MVKFVTNKKKSSQNVLTCTISYKSSLMNWISHKKVGKSLSLVLHNLLCIQFVDGCCHLCACTISKTKEISSDNWGFLSAFVPTKNSKRFPLVVPLLNFHFMGSQVVPQHVPKNNIMNITTYLWKGHFSVLMRDDDALAYSSLKLGPKTQNPTTQM